MLTTVEIVTVHLKGIGQDVPEDHKALVERFIKGVTDEVEHYCRRTFAKATYTDERLSGVVNQKHLFPKHWPILTMTTVTIDDGTSTTTITEGTEDTNWRRVKAENGDWYALYRADGWWSEPYGISLTYQAGYVLPKDHSTSTPRTLPEDLENAVVELVAGRYLNRGRAGVSAESFEGLSLTFDRWPLHILRTLGYYRAPRFAGA